MMLSSEWVGRRWFEMRTGYATYMAFTFGFANFILLLHGLTDWFRDYPLHLFGISMFAIIIPASILIGHRHNRTQQKTETRNLTHLNPYVNLLIPRSKDVFNEAYMHLTLDLMISTTSNHLLRLELEKIRAAVDRYRTGETATGALDKEGIRAPGPASDKV